MPDAVAACWLSAALMTIVVSGAIGEREQC